jgi:hypothetical protein
MLRSFEDRARRQELRWLAGGSEPVSWGTYTAVALMYAIGLVLALLTVWWLADWTATGDGGGWWLLFVVWPLLLLMVVAVAGCAIGLILWLVTGRRP